MTARPASRRFAPPDPQRPAAPALRPVIGPEPFLGVAEPSLGDEELAEVVEVVRSGWVVSGPRTAAFEAALQARLGVGTVRAVSSCTAALTLALRLEDVGPGDEVLLPSNTFVAGANVVVASGATPVLVDAEPGTGQIDLRHAATRVTPRTKALLVTHLGGRPLDPSALQAFGRRHGVAIVEDAAHAMGAAWGGRPVGAWGNLCAFSFHASKNVTTFEGGALVTRDAAEAERVARLAMQGLDRPSWIRHGSVSPAGYDVVEPGYKFGLSDVHAAVGVHQLRRLDGFLAHRAHVAEQYAEAFADLPVDLPPAVPEGVRHAWHLFAVRVRPEAGIARDDVVRRLRERGVGASVHFSGVHLLTYYRERCGVRPEDLPVSTDWSRRSMSLPMHPGLDESAVARVIDAVRHAFGAAR